LLFLVLVQPAVHFVFNTGISRPVFSNVRLSGSRDSGNPSGNWSSTPMQAITGTDGCPAFEATVNLNEAQTGHLTREKRRRQLGRRVA
jgi:1,4-alpha-glucan branching enzyme